MEEKALNISEAGSAKTILSPATNQFWYKPTIVVLICGIFPAIKHKITGELGSFGKAGEVWQWDEETFAILVRGRHRKALKIMAALAEVTIPKTSAFEEHVFHIKKCHYDAVFKALKVPQKRGRQVTMANRSNPKTNPEILLSTAPTTLKGE